MMASLLPDHVKLRDCGKGLRQLFLRPKSSLLDAQKEALHSLEAWFAIEDTKDYTAVVVMPTGSGKTGVICCLPFHIGGAIEAGVLSESEVDIRKPVLVIAPGIDILNQLQDNLELHPFLIERGFLKENEKHHNYFVFTVAKTADVEELNSKHADIILSNAQKWRKMKDQTEANYEDLPDDLFSMVIVDEAHHLPAKQWEEIVKKFRGHAKVVFFTATPDRCDGKPITTDGAIQANGYAYTLTREKAIKNRWIRPVKFTELSSSSSDDEAPPAKKAKKDAAYKHEERLEHAKEVLENVIQLMEEKNRDHPLPGGKKHASLIITKDTTEADEVKDICTDELAFDDDRVVVVHNNKFKKDKKKRKEEMKKIRNGEYEIIIIVNMLREGFDYPPFSIAGIVTKIVSFAKFSQFIGRIQRVVRHEGEQEVDIVGDIVTHEYFDQKKLYDRYEESCIRDEEDVLIDGEVSKEIWDLFCAGVAKIEPPEEL